MQYNESPRPYGREFHAGMKYWSGDLLSDTNPDSIFSRLAYVGINDGITGR